MRGQVPERCSAQRAGKVKADDPAAMGDVRLQDVHGGGLQHPTEIVDSVSVLAGGDVHAGGLAVRGAAQSVEIIPEIRLPKPLYHECGNVLRRTRSHVRR